MGEAMAERLAQALRPTQAAPPTPTGLSVDCVGRLLSLLRPLDSAARATSHEYINIHEQKVTRYNSLVNLLLMAGSGRAVRGDLAPALAAGASIPVDVLAAGEVIAALALLGKDTAMAEAAHVRPVAYVRALDDAQVLYDRAGGAPPHVALTEAITDSFEWPTAAAATCLPTRNYRPGSAHCGIAALRMPPCLAARNEVPALLRGPTAALRGGSRLLGRPPSPGCSACRRHTPPYAAA